MKDDLIKYILHLADNNLILGQRNAEWCGHGPVLEQDIALTNISLDLIGQARLLYQYAAELKGGESTEDTLAYLRTEREYLNVLLVEQPNGNWGDTIMRQFLYDAFNYFNYKALETSSDTQLAAIAAKSIKEVSYHLRFSSEWVVRLGDGTEESRDKMISAVNDLWKYTGEMFQATSYENSIKGAGISPDLGDIHSKWEEKVKEVLVEATIPVPSSPWMQNGGKKGIHSEHMGFILTELQYVQRTYPNLQW